MKSTILACGSALVLAAALTLTGCGNEKTKDVTGVTAQKPDKIAQYENVDQYPNVVVLCIHGVAFATTTREAAGAILRVPELDKPFCGSSN
jgi:hypothetical protein